MKKKDETGNLKLEKGAEGVTEKQGSGVGVPAVAKAIAGRQETAGKKEKSVILTFNSEEARMIATWALGHHQGVYLAASASVVRAIAVGIQLIKAKECLPFGEFQKWHKKYCPEITDRTVQKYMALVNAIKSNTNAGSYLKHLDVKPQELTEDRCRTIIPSLKKIIEGKSLSELYQDLGITKPRKESDEEAKRLESKVEARGPVTQEHRQLMFAEELFGEAIGRLHKWERFITEIKVDDPELFQKAEQELTAALERLTGKKVSLA